MLSHFSLVSCRTSAKVSVLVLVVLLLLLLVLVVLLLLVVVVLLPVGVLSPWPRCVQSGVLRGTDDLWRLALGFRSQPSVSY